MTIDVERVGAVTISRTPTLGQAQRPFRRSSDGAALGGVCAGLAVRFGVRARTIRVAVALSALLFGWGILGYLATWIVVRRSGEDQSILQRVSTRRRETFVLSVAVILGTIVVFDGTRDLRFRGELLVWIALACVAGLVVVARGATPDERVRLEDLLREAPLIGGSRTRTWRSVTVRVIIGVALIVAGLESMDRIGGVWSSTVPVILGGLVVIVGTFIVAAPWWLQTVRELSNERSQRVRADERSRIASHIHDSVLQTLTLIERTAEDSHGVVRLARAQERELRQWLFDPTGYESHDKSDCTFAEMLQALQSEVERDYKVRVELVVVGNCPSDDALRALVAAGREAAVNAAMWSGAQTISVFGESDQDTVTLCVRDTGCGFVPENVPADRHGIALSITRRVEALGGTVRLRSELGRGTDVELSLPQRHAS